MALTYSPDLRITLIGTGDQDGTWGTTTNTNLGTLIEQAVAGVAAISISSANQALAAYNGISDEARNAVLVLTSSSAANVFVPPCDKVYVVKNAGSYTITLYCSTVLGNTTAAGTGVAVPSGKTMLVYSDATNIVEGVDRINGNLTIGGTLAVTGNTTLTANVAANNATITNNISAATGTFTGAISSVSPAFTGTPTVPTASAGTSSTQAASTAFVGTAITNLSLGTMSTQNANNVTITGGSITGITDLAVADGGTGSSSLSANAVLLGNGTSALQTVAPGTSGNLLTSNGTTWTSAAPPANGLGINQTWSAPSRSPSTTYTNSSSSPIFVLVILGMSFSGNGTAKATVDGVDVGSMSYDTTAGGSGCPTTLPFIVPPGKTYSVTITNDFSIQSWTELA